MASFRRSIVVSILFTVFGGPGFLFVYVPYLITRFHIPAGEPMWQRAVAAAMILAGIIPLLASALRFIYAGHGTLVPAVPTERLVVSGLYRHVRNPMYAGGLLALAGEALLFSSRHLVYDLIFFWLAAYLFILVYEEPTLARRYPEDYARYKRNVPRWIPRLSPWDANLCDSVSRPR